MNDDDLRTRLARLDPARQPAIADDAAHARAQTLLEAVMTAPIDTPTTDAGSPAAPVAHGHASAAHGGNPSVLRRRMDWLPVGAAAAIVALAAGAAMVFGGDDAEVAPAGDRTLTLAGPDSTVLASCLAFDEKILADMPVAFGGTVTSVADGGVTLDVDRWFSPADSDVDTVELTTPAGQSVALDGVEFAQGNRYLVTATEGNVNTCGYSGPATPEYEASFERAFAGG